VSRDVFLISNEVEFLGREYVLSLFLHSSISHKLKNISPVIFEYKHSYCKKHIFFLYLIPSHKSLFSWHKILYISKFRFWGYILSPSLSIEIFPEEHLLLNVLNNAVCHIRRFVFLWFRLFLSFIPITIIPPFWI
jgi:hypothetical protein